MLNNKLKSLFPYYGGKVRIASKICELIPPHKIYVEPFCGSAAVLFRKGRPDVSAAHYREVLNDRNSNIVNLFRVLQDKDKYEEFLHKITYTPYSREEYQKAVLITKNDNNIVSDIDKAWAFYFNQQASFASDTSSGFAFAKKGENDPFTFMNKKKNLSLFVERLQYCYIEHTDALECIKRWDSPETCFYIDPPYPNTNQGSYSGYTQDDFIQLIECLNNIKGSFVLSCYNNDAVPNDWQKHEISTKMSAALGAGRVGGKADRTECVWVKDNNIYS